LVGATVVKRGSSRFLEMERACALSHRLLMMPLHYQFID
jgi:hypothetical protein